MKSMKIKEVKKNSSGEEDEMEKKPRKEYDVNFAAKSQYELQILELNPEIGSESMIRFLKTKIKVLQDDVNRLFQDNHNLMKENANLEKDYKEIAESKEHLQLQLTQEQQKLEKFVKLYEDAKVQIAVLVTESTTLKKELEVSNKIQKQTSSNQSTIEIRFNKALEQLEKYKNQLEKMEQRHKEAIAKELKKNEDLFTENKKLTKQKNDLLLGFKKQMMLIDVLKKQKVHLEAASVLQFSEDEFLKLLDWKIDLD